MQHAMPCARMRRARKLSLPRAWPGSSLPGGTDACSVRVLHALFSVCLSMLFYIHMQYGMLHFDVPGMQDPISGPIALNALNERLTNGGFSLLSTSISQHTLPSLPRKPSTGALLFFLKERVYFLKVTPQGGNPPIDYRVHFLFTTKSSSLFFTFFFTTALVVIVKR